MRTFNTTGTCIKDKHFMVDINKKLNKIISLIDKEKYFVINRPRQFGKTTTLSLLSKAINEKYTVMAITFEGVGDEAFKNEEKFCNIFIDLLIKSLRFTNKEEYVRIKSLKTKLYGLNELSDFITEYIEESEKETILIIDEVDKSSNNQLFISFLGMLRAKYLQAMEGKDLTFKSVVLAGVHDIKNLKLRFRNDNEEKYNSPWNIAIDFNVDMSFSVSEISTMIKEYCEEKNLNINIDEISKRIYYFTNGYPFLVSKICQIIDEIIYEEDLKPWNIKDIDKSVKIITRETNTLFESIIKNLENNNELYKLINRILINNEFIAFNILDPIINLGVTYGIIINIDGRVAIGNKIFEEIIYNYMISKIITKTKDMSKYNLKNNFITNDNGLDIEKVLIKFKQYMKENYSSLDAKFIEREGRLIFLAFITPIINGTGFALKEVQISEEKRLDVLITYNNFKYIIELKIWYGESYHQKGIEQLVDYLDINDLNKGYLIAFNFNKNKEYKEENIIFNDKQIFTVYV